MNLRVFKDWWNKIVDKEGFEFLELCRHLRTRDDLRGINDLYDPFKISLNTGGTWTFRFIDYDKQSRTTSILKKFDVSEIFAIDASKADLPRYDSLLALPERISETPQNEELFLKLLSGLQEEFDRDRSYVMHIKWCDRNILCNTNYSHRTIAVLKYLHSCKTTAFLSDVRVTTIDIPPEFEGFSTFVLNPKPTEGYNVTTWLRQRGLRHRYLNNHEIFVSIPSNSRLDILLVSGSPTYGIWRNPFF